MASRGAAAIFWDMENCRVPKGVRAEDAASNAFAALKASMAAEAEAEAEAGAGSGARWVQVKAFSAYADLRGFSRRTREACTKSGVVLIHVHGDKKEAADRAILLDMFLFAMQNPPPFCTIMLISGDAGFAPALHKLAQRGYSILLAAGSMMHLSPILHSACRHVVDWQSIARGGSVETVSCQQLIDWQGAARREAVKTLNQSLGDAAGNRSLAMASCCEAPLARGGHHAASAKKVLKSSSSLHRIQRKSGMVLRSGRRIVMTDEVQVSATNKQAKQQKKKNTKKKMKENPKKKMKSYGETISTMCCDKGATKCPTSCDEETKEIMAKQSAQSIEIKGQDRKQHAQPPVKKETKEVIAEQVLESNGSKEQNRGQHSQIPAVTATKKDMGNQAAPSIRMKGQSRGQHAQIRAVTATKKVIANQAAPSIGVEGQSRGQHAQIPAVTATKKVMANRAASSIGIHKGKHAQIPAVTETKQIMANRAAPDIEIEGRYMKRHFLPPVHRGTEKAIAIQAPRNQGKRKWKDEMKQDDDAHRQVGRKNRESEALRDIFEAAICMGIIKSPTATQRPPSPCMHSCGHGSSLG